MVLLRIVLATGTNSAAQEIPFVLGTGWKRPILLWGNSKGYVEVGFYLLSSQMLSALTA